MCRLKIDKRGKKDFAIVLPIVNNLMENPELAVSGFVLIFSVNSNYYSVEVREEIFAYYLGSAYNKSQLYFYQTVRNSRFYI